MLLPLGLAVSLWTMVLVVDVSTVIVPSFPVQADVEKENVCS